MQRKRASTVLPGSLGNISLSAELSLKNSSYSSAIESITTYEPILLENDEASKTNATQDPQNIKRETEFILGSTRDWSSENEEAILFRENMEKF